MDNFTLSHNNYWKQRDKMVNKIALKKQMQARQDKEKEVEEEEDEEYENEEESVYREVTYDSTEESTPVDFESTKPYTIAESWEVIEKYLLFVKKLFDGFVLIMHIYLKENVPDQYDLLNECKGVTDTQLADAEKSLKVFLFKMLTFIVYHSHYYLIVQYSSRFERVSENPQCYRRNPHS